MSGRDPFQDLADEASIAAAAEARAARRALGEAEAADASLAGALRAVAQRGGSIVVTLVTGHRVRGRLTAVAHDHVVVRGEHGVAWVRHAGIATVAASAGRRAAAGPEPARPTLEWATALHELVTERVRIVVHAVGSEPVPGSLSAVGQDVLTVQSDDQLRTTLVPTANAVAVVVPS